MKGTRGLAAAFALWALQTACGGDGRIAWTAADSVDIAAAVPAAPARTRPTDAQIAHILNEANGVAARAAQHARTRVQTPAVTAYAATVDADHRAMRARMETLARDIGLAAAEHPLSIELSEAGTADIEELGAITGAPYEAAYIEGQIAFHERALALIDDVLAPAAQNEQLSAFVRSVRPAFAAHLQRAFQIRQLLAQAAPAPDPDTTRQ